MSKQRIVIETGEEYGRLTVIKEMPSQDYMGNKTRMLLCECICGKMVEKPLHGVKSGNVKSCGCLLKEIHLAMANNLKHY